MLGSEGNLLVEPISFDLMTVVLLILLGALLWSTIPTVSLKFSTEEE
jgi:hypothetical protein